MATIQVTKPGKKGERFVTPYQAQAKLGEAIDWEHPDDCELQVIFKDPGAVEVGAAADAPGKRRRRGHGKKRSGPGGHSYGVRLVAADGQVYEDLNSPTIIIQ